MRVLVVAYACARGRGSEPGAGFEWASAISSFSDITILTREKFVKDLSDTLRVDHVRVVGHDIRWLHRALRAVKMKKVYYIMWQISAARVARRLHRESEFDFAHHLTFAIDSVPSPAILLPDVIRVWGPVGGFVTVDPFSWRVLGTRSVIESAFRRIFVTLARFLTRRYFVPHVHRVITQNNDVAQYFGRSKPVVEPNIALHDYEVENGQRQGGERQLLFVGRLVGWKGVSLVLRSMREPGMDDTKLRICGSGPDERRLQRLVKRSGLEGRVEFLGQIDRENVYKEFLTADALVQPSLRDSAGWVVGEALLAGLPVIVTDIGGPAELVRRCGGGIVLPYSRHLPSSIALALRNLPKPECLGRAACDPLRAERLPELLKTLYMSIQTEQGTSSHAHGHRC